MQLRQLWRAVNIKRVACVLLIALTLVWLLFYLLSHPVDILKPELSIAGLQDTGKIVIDSDAIYYISVNNEPDLYRILGFIQAARHIDFMDRLLRAATGKLAQAYGEKALPADRFAQLLGFERLGNRAAARLDTTTRILLTAYAEGINQVIRQHGRDVSVMWSLKGVVPLEWNAARVIAVTRLYSWLLTADWRLPLLLTKTAAIYGDEKVRDGFPLLTDFASHQVDSTTLLLHALNRFYQDAQVFESYFLPEDERLCSAPLITNRLTSQAIIVQLHDLPWPEMIVGLHCPQFDAVGYMLPGMPYLLAGKTAEHSWSVAWNKKPTLKLYFLTNSLDDDSYYENTGQKTLQPVHYQLTKGKNDTVFKEFWLAGQMPLLDISGHQVAWIGLDWDGNNYAEIQLLMNLMRTTALPAALRSYPDAVLPPLQIAWWDIDTKQSAAVAVGGKTDWRSGTTPLIRYEWIDTTGCDARVEECQFIPDPKIGSQTHLMTIPQCHQAQYEQVAPIWTTCRPFLYQIEHPLHPWADRLLTTWIQQPVVYSAGARLWDIFQRQLEEAIFNDELAIIDNYSPSLLKQWMAGKRTNLARLLQDGSSSWLNNLETSDQVESLGQVIRQAWEATLTTIQAQYGPDTLNFQLAARKFAFEGKSPSFWANLWPGERKMPDYFCQTAVLRNLVLPNDDRPPLRVQFSFLAPQLCWQLRVQELTWWSTGNQVKRRVINLKRSIAHE